MRLLDKVKNWEKRATRIVKLRDEGKTFAEIGRIMGITRAGAHITYHREKRRKNAI